jgi:hypothetical protein
MPLFWVLGHISGQFTVWDESMSTLYRCREAVSFMQINNSRPGKGLGVLRVARADFPSRVCGKGMPPEETARTKPPRLEDV